MEWSGPTIRTDLGYAVTSHTCATGMSLQRLSVTDSPFRRMAGSREMDFPRGPLRFSAMASAMRFTWEPALFAPHHRLDNLVAIVDYNKLQSLGKVKDTLDLEPFRTMAGIRWACAGSDGHDIPELVSSCPACFRSG